MPYIGKSSNGFGIRERFRYTATSNQTAFTGNDSDSKPLIFDNGSLIDVFYNGVLLDTTDYNTSTANTVTLTSGADTGAELMMIVYDVFSLSDAMTKTGGAFSGAVSFAGTVTGSGLPTLITNNTTGGTASELVFDLSMDTSYLYQRYIIEDVYSSGTGDVWWRSRRASDDTYFTGSSDYAYAYHYAATGGTSGTGSSGDSKGRLNGYGIGNASTEKRRWVIDIYDNSTSGSQTHVMWRNSGHYDGGICDEIGMSMELATTTTNQWKMYNGSGGTLTYSGYVHYGIKRA